MEAFAPGTPKHEHLVGMDSRKSGTMMKASLRCRKAFLPRALEEVVEEGLPDWEMPAGSPSYNGTQLQEDAHGRLEQA